MTRDLLRVLCCPSCQGELALGGEEPGDSDWVESGDLGCTACGASYPILRGVPRFVGQDAYARSFSYEWNRWNRVQIDGVNGGTESEETFIEKTGLHPEDVRGKLVLDVGCGAGRFLDVVARWGADAVGIDVSFAVEAARVNLDARGRVNVVQADVFHLPFREESFDIVFSIGVLHHTPDTRAAFVALPRLLRDGGVIAVWLYYYTDRLRSAASDFWRAIFSRVPASCAYAWCWLLVFLLSPLYRSRASRWPLVRHLPRLVPISEHPTFEWRVLDTFDWWTPVYQDKDCSPKRVIAWFGACGLRHLEVLDRATAVRGRRDDSARLPLFARIMPTSVATRFLVFGAGAGGVAAIRALRSAGVQDRIIGICDNDPAKSGRRVEGLLVREFGAWPRESYDFVIIASAIGVRSMAEQLEAAGLVRGAQFGTVDYVTTIALPYHRSAA